MDNIHNQVRAIITFYKGFDTPNIHKALDNIGIRGSLSSNSTLVAGQVVDTYDYVGYDYTNQGWIKLEGLSL